MGTQVAEGGAGTALIRHAAFRPPTRSVTASASRIEGAEYAQCTDTITANPTSSDGNYARQGSNAAWSNPSYIYSNNNTYASVSIGGESKSRFLRAGGFALGDLPDDAIIRGLAVSIRRYAGGDAPIVEAVVTLIKQDVRLFSNRATGVQVPHTPTTALYGGATDLWEEAFPVASEFKASIFGVLLGYDNNYVGVDVVAYVLVDHVSVTIYDDHAPDCSGISSTSSWAGSASGWTNPSNATGAPNGVGATISATGNQAWYIGLSGFSFSQIPSNHTILGVQVTLYANVTGAAQKWHYITIYSGGMQIVCRPKFPFVEPTDGDFHELAYGHCEDTWPLTNGAQNCFEPGHFTNQPQVLIQLEGQ